MDADPPGEEGSRAESPIGPAHAGAADPTACRHLAFEAGGSWFALPLSQVHAVLRPRPVTPVPFLGPAVLGAVEARGEIVPLLDLSAALGGKPTRLEGEARLVVIGSRERLVGVIADRLGEVLTLGDEDRVRSLDRRTLGGPSLVAGVARHGNQVYSLLEVEELPAHLSPKPTSPGSTTSAPVVGSSEGDGREETGIPEPPAGSDPSRGGIR